MTQASLGFTLQDDGGLALTAHSAHHGDVKTLTPLSLTLALVLCLDPLGTVAPAQVTIDTTAFNTAGAVTVLDLLQNAVPGLQVTAVNGPGGVVTLRIRGTGSVNGSNDPLIVVDGVPLSPGGGLSLGNDPLEFLDPADIASVAVVKDGTAARYGRGSNGVILITTKSGSGTPRVEYGGSYSTATITRLPSVLSTNQFRAAVARYDTAGLSQLGGANTDWLGLIDQTGSGETHHASLSGGTGSSAYRLGAGYTDANGVLDGSSTRRISLGIDYRQRLDQDRLDLRVALRGARLLDGFTPGGVLENAVAMGPTQPVYDATAATGYANWPGNTLTSADNPVEILRTSSDQATIDRGTGSLAVAYDFSRIRPLRGLRGGLTLGFDAAQASRVAFSPNNIHSETKTGEDGSFAEVDPRTGTTLVDASLGYVPPRAVGPGRADFTLGYAWWYSSSRVSLTSVTGLSTNLLGPNGIPTSNLPPSVGLATDHEGMRSVYGGMRYDVDDRYFFAAGLRRDGTSRFDRDHAWATFPWVAASWRALSGPGDLTVRASWGRSGNEELGPGITLSGLVSCPLACLVVDPNLTWETSRTVDLGGDLGLAGGRFTGSLDWYDKRNDGAILFIPVPVGPGFTNYVLSNAGAVRNRGIELGLTAALVRPASRGGFAWTATFTAAHNANDLVSINSPALVFSTRILTGPIAGGVGSTIQVLEPGQPVNSFFACRQEYSGGKPVEGHYLTLAGVDTTACALGLNTVAEHDPAPHWMFGLTSRVTYGRLALSVSLRAWVGNYVYDNAASALGDYGALASGSAPLNLSSSVLTTGFVTQQLLSDYYVENGSFLRLDDLMVGYTFPWQGEALRVYVDVRNVFTITGYRGVDPASVVNGIDNGVYPPSRVFTGGLTVRL